MCVSSHAPLEPNPDHTLVVVFLRGGADGLNMVVPVEDDSYHRLRPTLGVSEKDALPLDGFFAFHPSLEPLRPVYADGTLAIIHQAGSDDDTRSHFEAQDLMEHGSRGGGGWMGRWLRARGTQSPLAAVSIGETRAESMRGAPASIALASPSDFTFGVADEAFSAGLARLYGRETGLLGTAGQDTLRAMASLEALASAPYRPANGAAYPSNRLGRDLEVAAQLVKSGVGVSAITVDHDGWDTHFGEAVALGGLMDALARSLAAFQTDLGTELERCTVLVMSEFGRRAYENASFGTDHGRGGVMFVLGGGVHGGRVIAEWRGLGLEGLEGPGDLPVVNDYRNVVASVLARHGGVSNASEVFPDFLTNPVDLYT